MRSTIGATKKALIRKLRDWKSKVFMYQRNKNM